MPVSGPLAGLLVIDLTRVLAGPYCTMLLAELGARVVKVELPGRGDDARYVGPFVAGESAYFASLNRGKESIALDLKEPGDRARFEGLIARADVLTENFRPGVMDRLGYGWAALHARHPRLVMASISGFGQTGPYADRPAYDVIVQAMGGLMSLTGHPGGPPTRAGTSIGDIAAGLFALVGIQAALLERERTGAGAHVDVSMLDSQVAILENAIARHQVTGEIPGPMGSRHPSISPFEALPTADGHIVVAAGNDGLFRQLCRTLGCEELGRDPRFAENEGRRENADALSAALGAALAAHPTAHWIDVLGEAGIPCGPLNDVSQVALDPQVLARRMIVSAPDAAGNDLKMAGNPVKIAGHEDPATRKPAPSLDADRDAILALLADA